MSEFYCINFEEEDLKKCKTPCKKCKGMVKPKQKDGNNTNTAV